MSTRRSCSGTRSSSASTTHGTTTRQPVVEEQTDHRRAQAAGPARDQRRCEHNSANARGSIRNRLYQSAPCSSGGARRRSGHRRWWLGGARIPSCASAGGRSAEYLLASSSATAPGSSAAVAWEGADRPARLLHGPAGAVHVHRALRACTRATARRWSSGRAARASRSSTTPSDLLDGPPRSAEDDGDRPARPARDDPEPAPAAAARPAASARAPGWAGLPRRAGSEVLPPGLPPRAARALACPSPRPWGSFAGTFPGIDRDVAVTGALLHDIGKLEAYVSQGRAIDLSDEGKLQGEIPLGYYRVRRAIEDLARLPARRGPGGAPHRPRPPRPVRARQPGRPRHARGDARAHARQPRRAPGLLRPARKERPTGQQ